MLRKAEAHWERLPTAARALIGLAGSVLVVVILGASLSDTLGQELRRLLGLAPPPVSATASGIPLSTDAAACTAQLKRKFSCNTFLATAARYNWMEKLTLRNAEEMALAQANARILSGDRGIRGDGCDIFEETVEEACRAYEKFE